MARSGGLLRLILLDQDAKKEAACGGPFVIKWLNLIIFSEERFRPDKPLPF